MEKVADGVYRIGGYVNCYLIDGDQGVTLVDTGLPKKEGAVLSALSEIGREMSDIDTIVVTHGHADHFGCARVLKAESGSQLVASQIDASYVRGEQPPPLPPFTERFGILKPLLKLMPAPDGVEVDLAVGGDEPVSLVSDLSAIQTPGHTPGHMSLLLDRDGGILFVGDAATRDKAGNVQRGWMNHPGRDFDHSLRKLAELDFEMALFGHSDPLDTDASGAFRRFVETI